MGELHKLKDIKKEVKIENYCDEKFVSSWIMGYPLTTEYGFINPIRVRDYWMNFELIEFLKLQDWQIKREILKYLKKNDTIRFDRTKEEFEKADFMTCVRNNVSNLRNEYVNVFSNFIEGFDEKDLWRMKLEDMNNLRKLILEFNHITYNEENPNPEIERYNRKKIYMAIKKGGVVEFDTIYSTLMTKEGGGMSPDEINDLTMRQFYLAYNRIEYVKSNEVTTLFKTVDSKDSIKIVEWNHSFREKEEETIYSSLEDIKKNNVFLKNK